MRVLCWLQRVVVLMIATIKVVMEENRGGHRIRGSEIGKVKVSSHVHMSIGYMVSAGIYT